MTPPLSYPSNSSQIQYSRVFLVTLILLGLLLGAIALSLVKGTVSLTPSELTDALLRRGSLSHQVIVWELRLPRIAAAALVGSSLGLAGGLMQGLLRNSLATPYLLGVSAGAGLVAASLIVLGVSAVYIPAGAWCGAIVAALLVYGLAWNGGQIAIDRLILGGVALNSLLGALQTTLIVLSDDSQIQQAFNWLVGSLNGRGWSEVNAAAPYLLLALLVGCLLGRLLNLLNLGDDMAVGLGLSLGRSRLLIGATATLLAAGAASIGGLIGFVGLIVPHGVRLFVGSDHRLSLPLSALGGAIVLILADWLARLGAIELPVGAVMALMGSPVFLLLLYRRRVLN